LLITKLQLVATRHLIIFVHILFPLFLPNPGFIVRQSRPGLQCEVQ